jgi:hypothetical protein
MAYRIDFLALIELDVFLLGIMLAGWYVFIRLKRGRKVLLVCVLVLVALIWIVTSFLQVNAFDAAIRDGGWDVFLVIATTLCTCLLLELGIWALSALLFYPLLKGLQLAILVFGFYLVILAILTYYLVGVSDSFNAILCCRSDGISLDTMRYSVSVGLFSTILLDIGIAVSLMILSFINRTMEKWKNSHHPVEVIIHNLILTLREVETESINSINLEVKRRQVLRMEVVAHCFEYYLFEQLASGDIITDGWLRKMTKEMALAIREKKRWLLTPTNNNQEEFLNRIVSVLICVIKGNWDAIERMEPEKLTDGLPSLPPLRRPWVVNLLKTVAIAILPVLGFSLVQWSPWAIKGPFLDYMVIGLFIWVFLVFVSTLDPNLSNRLSILKNLRDLLSSSNNSKSET